MAIFDLIPGAVRALTLSPAALWIAAGLVGWVVLKHMTNRVTQAGLPADASRPAMQAGLAAVSSLGFWLHSFLEGATVAVSFAISPRLGVLVGTGMLLHLVPEFAAITTLLRAEGVSRLRSVVVDLVGIAVLWTTAVGLSFTVLSGHVRNVLEAITGGVFIAIGVMSYTARRRTIGTAAGLVAGILAAALWRLAVP